LFEAEVSDKAMDARERALLDALQTELPLCERPFEEVGARVGLAERDVLLSVARLKEAGVIRQISAIFDTRKLGYKSTLVAARVPPERLEAAAAVVSAHPGVSHNYERAHAYNLWFTLAVPPGADLDTVLERMAEEAGFERTLPLPALRVFRIGVRFRMGEEDDRPSGNGTRAHRHGRGGAPLTDFDRQAIRELQEDFDVCEQPYAAIAGRLGVSQEAVFDWARGMAADGRLRRISAVLHHRAAGFTANAMVVWQVAPERIEEIGTGCGELPEVSHCYQRPTFDDWPYSLYTMIHGREKGDCDRVIARIEERFGALPHAVLYSTREFKKERVRYFVEDQAVR
jgi:DNA-binding Lrp family transcriptional regulator